MENSYQKIKQGIAGSYSQVFFSDNKVLAGLLLGATFLDPVAGGSGLLAVIFAVLFVNGIGLNPVLVNNGTYTFNVLLTGLALGAFYDFSLTYVILLAVAALITVLITVAVSAVSSRYKLPFLSLPFVLSVWILFLNLRVISFPDLHPRFLFGAFSAHAAGIDPIDKFGLLLDTNYLPCVISGYFHSLGAVFFQHNVIAGIIIAGGLLYSSRISFTLSLIGYISGYLFFNYVQFPSGDIHFADFGFNYILTAMAIGGFFLIPSWKTYLTVIVVTPVIGLLSVALFRFAVPYFLPLYSLPFTISVILILQLLYSRYSGKQLHLVQYQLYSPEKNLYAFHTYMERFKNDTLLHIHLPFYGEWNVSQGHSGKITHKDEWRFAWDFVVKDEEQNTFRLPGKSLADFYCYALPVLAPADGTVVTLIDGIEDNEIGDVNLNENWGNTIVIRHSEYIFTKISHLKKDSFKVKEGDFVKKGELIALCGNSGRSPEPHIHFQVQSTPFAGAKTIEYPVCYFVTKNEGQFELHSFDSPREDVTLLPPRPDSLLQKAFHFIPGMEMKIQVKNENEVQIENWEVRTDELNNSYFYCMRTGSTAYFTNNETLFYFTSYSGDQDAFLYYFFLGAYKILLSYFQDLEIHDNLPVETRQLKWIKPVQDFAAPFVIFNKPVYKALFISSDNIHSPEEISIHTEVIPASGEANKIAFDLLIAEQKISSITVTEKGQCFTAEII